MLINAPTHFSSIDPFPPEPPRIPFLIEGTSFPPMQIVQHYAKRRHTPLSVTRSSRGRLLVRWNIRNVLKVPRVSSDWFSSLLATGRVKSLKTYRRFISLEPLLRPIRLLAGLVLLIALSRMVSRARSNAGVVGVRGREYVK